MLSYTLAQLRAFTAAAARDDRLRLVDFALAMRVAFGADAAGWQKYQTLMTGGDPVHPPKELPTNG
ncbi:MULTISPECIES: hypothetical protein [Bacteria]|uniref:hypothetical protein n=1 Tax=Bacteria TaxID=2 RepID=UPI00070BA7F0|nr:hypothetical protein [Stenotrophomonas geniculata]KRG43055.1 hypothetical protein ARC63_10480 [Stenotrophomonas geniculata ATCC 19374 = JCM 13324]